VRAYLRNRAGLPPIMIGVGILNQGHRSLYERELLFLHDVLPKDAGVHDGLQLLDGADDNRHLALSAPTPVAATVPSAAPVGPAPAVSAAGSAPSAAAPVVLGAPAVAALPTPPHAMRLAPLPAGVPILPGSQAAREAERQLPADWDEEEDDEIRPVSNESAAQWAAYRATRH